MYPASYNIGTEIRLVIPRTFSHTRDRPYDPYLLVLVFPALQRPFITVGLSLISVRNSGSKKVW